MVCMPRMGCFMPNHPQAACRIARLDDACILQTALTVAVSGYEIWAAVGTYKPTSDVNDRTATFQLKDGVALYGGFAGTETARSDRNPAARITILSGDLNGNDNNTIEYDEPTRAENSYHVVTGATGQSWMASPSPQAMPTALLLPPTAAADVQR